VAKTLGFPEVTIDDLSAGFRLLGLVVLLGEIYHPRISLCVTLELLTVDDSTLGTLHH